ncbi:MAG: hypothetical protein ACI9NC_003522 [Verrucomicrobiales bacterium]|jgi:hypothetical protein
MAAKMLTLAVFSALLVGVACAQSSWIGQTTGTNKALRGVAYDGIRFVCVADDGIIITSTDGVTWTAASSGTTNSLRSVASAPTLWVAAGESGSILTSPDGITWTTQTTPVGVANKQLSGVAYGNGTYVAVGASGKVIHSSDGIMWSEASTVPLLFFLQSVTFGGGKFVAVGVSGTIMHSIDGSTWVAASAGTSAFLNGVTYGDGRFIIVGQSNSAFRSSDGITWTQHLTGSAAPLRDIQYGDGRFIAVGEDGVILASDEGLNWDAQTSGIVESSFGLTYGAGAFVAVGGRLDEQAPGVPSRIITSPSGLDFGFEWETNLLAIPETGTTATFNITRIGPTDTAASVQWSITGGSANAPGDFTDTSGIVPFSIGETMRQISIPISDDADVEGQESIELTLQPTSPSHVVHGNPLAIINILDDEDMDSDGLEDSWEVLHFASIASYDASDDPDSDNNNNAREQDQGTDPDDDTSAKYVLSTGIVSGSGDVSASPFKVLYDAGDIVTLTATPALGYEFDGWTDFSLPQATPVDLPPLDADTSIDALFGISLSAALDQPGIDWLTGSTGSSWLGQTTFTFDTEDAAMADGNDIGQGDLTILEAVVPGNSTLTFRWLISAGFELDYLRFSIDGDEVDSISGMTAWEKKNYTLEPGLHLLTWSFERSFGSPAGLNAAWLDTVAITQSFSQWQTEHFTPSEILDPLISGPDADPDYDSQTNFFEYAFAINPRSGNIEVTMPQISIELGGSGSDHIAITFSRPITRWAELNYVVESSTTLLPGSWITVNTPHAIISTLSGVQSVRVVDPAPMSLRKHYRVSVTGR